MGRPLATQHVIAPCTRPEHRPAAIEPAGDGNPMAWVSGSRRERMLRMLETCREEVRERLDMGAIGWEAHGRRHALLWGFMDLSVALDGSDMRAEWPEHESGMGRCLPRADLAVPIGSMRWYTAFDPVLFRAARRIGLDAGMLAGGPSGEWARHSLRRTFRRYVDWNRLRRAVLAWLAPEPLAVALTRRVFHGCAPSLAQFNWVHRHSRGLARIAIERPRLLPFLRLAATAEDCPLESFEAGLRGRGITPSARRKLELWGWPVFDEAIEAAMICDPDDIVARLANRLERLRVDHEPPPLFGALAVAGEEFLPDWFLRALLDEMLRREDEGLADAAPDAYAEAIAWLRGKPKPPDRNQARAGWHWIEAQARSHAAAVDEDSRRPWRVPCDDFDAGRWRVVAIRNPGELREEARAMRNCLETYEAYCRFESMAVFSVRDRESGRRAACFSLDLKDRIWRLGQVAGERNSPVAAGIMEVAMATLQRCCAPAAGA